MWPIYSPPLISFHNGRIRPGAQVFQSVLIFFKSNYVRGAPSFRVIEKAGTRKVN